MQLNWFANNIYSQVQVNFTHFKIEYSKKIHYIHFFEHFYSRYPILTENTQNIEIN